MVYLDYSATTPVNIDVLDTFNKVSTGFIGNPNSLHKLGVEAKNLIDASTKQIANILNIKENEIIYTSGASEANNTAIKGVCLRYQKRGKHIITTHFEHSSIYGPISYLQTLGFEVDFVKTNEFGIVDENDLKNLLREDTILVTIGAVNSEIGILQPINNLAKIVKENSKAYFHSDFTQLIGKKECSLENIDLISFSAHKFYGIKGIGVLIKKENIELLPIIHGGKSTTKYRSGTPCVALIASLAKALRLANESLTKYNDIKNLNQFLKKELLTIEGIKINSNEYCIPQILNISVLNIKPETLLHALESEEIYISTQTACASENSYSKAVLALTNDEQRAKSSVRISLSHVTTKEEITLFINVLKKKIQSLRMEYHENN